MKGTGVYATEEEMESLMTLVKVSGMWIGGPPVNPAERCHKYALAHGLPEITGFYGIKGDGEFVRDGE
jgi:hypothetical protein